MPNGDAIRGIEIIEGNNNVLLIAPHAFNGDRSRGLKADDENTGALTQEIASSLASYAIINKFYKRSRKENSNSQNSKEIPEPEKDRINLYRYDQSKDHITAYLQLIDNIVTKIVRAYGHAIVLWIHGLGDDSLEDIRMSDGYNDVNVLIGIGRRNDGETAYAETANKLIDALESNKEFRTIAKLATAQTGYQGAHENVLNQYFLKQKGYDLSEVESMQLEIQKPGFRDRASIPAAAKAFATAIGHLIPKNVEVVPAQNIKPKSNLVERAFFNLSEIFSRHFEKAMTEAGQYILEEFFGGDIERARAKKPTVEGSLHQLIQRFKQEDSRGPSKSWIYNAVDMVVQNHDLEGFHTYGKLELSKKVRLLSVRDADQKKQLIEEAPDLTVRKLAERVKEVKAPKTRKSSTLPITKPEELFHPDNRESIQLESLLALPPDKLDKFLDKSRNKLEQINENIDRLNQLSTKYSSLISNLEKAKWAKTEEIIEPEYSQIEQHDNIRNPEMNDSVKNWNVVTGCDKYSDGCLNCYAEHIVLWQNKLGGEEYIQNVFNLTCHHERLNWPLEKLPKKPRRPARLFVTDMGDLFHDQVPDDFIFKVFETMLEVPQHRFYVLTKRSERLEDLGPKLPWRPWIWAGVTVESNKYLDRIRHLKSLPPEANKFLMLEPLLSEMPKLDLEGIHWVIVGGETNEQGKFRPMEEKWVIDIRDQVKAAGLPFMFKHWAGKSQNSKEALLEGRIWNEFPESVVSYKDFNNKNAYSQKHSNKGSGSEPKWMNIDEPAIISASRRTDIPACYSEWFMNCLDRGYVGYLNPFVNTKHMVSLKLEDIACFVFWSKNFEPFMDVLKKVKRAGYNCYIQFTITGLPRSFEPNVIETQKALELFKEICGMFTPELVHWRYDPIVISDKTNDDYHLDTFSRIASELEGYTHRCYFSYPTLYGKVERSIKKFQEEENTKIFDTAEDQKIDLANRLADVALNHGLIMNSCCGEYLVGEKIQKARCVDGELISNLYFNGDIKFRSNPTREGCGCSHSYDIGAYDTCRNGCFYCYANINKEKALKSFENHDPHTVFLGHSSEESGKWIIESNKVVNNP